MITFNITSDSDQKFSTIINGQRVTIRLWYAVFNDRWSADISIDGAPVLHGRKIITGVDLLEPFNFNIGVFFAFSEKGFEAGRNHLSEGTVKIYHTTREEVDATVSS